MQCNLRESWRIPFYRWSDTDWFIHRLLNDAVSSVEILWDRTRGEVNPEQSESKDLKETSLSILRRF